MKVKVIKSVTDDFCNQAGPSTVTNVFISLGGVLFHLGKFYEGPHMNKGTAERLEKILEFERRCEEALDQEEVA